MFIVIWHCKSVKYQPHFFTLDKGNCWLFGNGGGRNIHTVGTSICPFRVTLSAKTPGSFESRCGCVRYKLEGKFQKHVFYISHYPCKDFPSQ